MRILTLSYEFPPIGGGGARVVAGLSRELARRGHTVDLVTMGFRGLPRSERVQGVAVHRIPCLRRRTFLCTVPEAASYVVRALPRVWRLVRRNHYDLIHAHFIFPDGLIAWLVSRATRRPYVITAHGSDVPGYNPHRLKAAHALLAPLWRRIVGSAAQLICPSQMLQSLVLQRAPQTQVSVIPNGIDLNRFSSNGVRRPRILVVTRMLKRKGVQYLLKAFEGLTRGQYEVHLVGEGPYLPVLQQMVAANGDGAHVRFWGWLDNYSPQLKALYETSRIFVLPSEAENFPVVLLEAMAAGLAIITSRGTGCAEVVGDTAMLVPPKDAEAIRSALTHLLRDEGLAQRLGASARRRLEACFSWQAIAHEYVELYARAARGPGGLA